MFLKDSDNRISDRLVRMQIINNLGYVVGESKSRYQRRHHRLKLQIQEVRSDLRTAYLACIKQTCMWHIWHQETGRLMQQCTMQLTRGRQCALHPLGSSQSYTWDSRAPSPAAVIHCCSSSRSSRGTGCRQTRCRRTAPATWTLCCGRATATRRTNGWRANPTARCMLLLSHQGGLGFRVGKHCLLICMQSRVQGLIGARLCKAGKMAAAGVLQSGVVVPQSRQELFRCEAAARVFRTNHPAWTMMKRKV